MKTIAKYLLCSLFVLCLNTNSSIGADLFRVIDSRAGLCDNSVNCIRQDGQGFIWMATSNGLCRYDGLLFYTFRHNPYDHTSISGNNVSRIAMGTEGFWVTTNAGMDFYSFNSGTFLPCSKKYRGHSRPIKDNCHSMVYANGVVLAATDGGTLLVKDKNAEATLFEPSPIKKRIDAVCTYTNGRFLAMGKDGIYILSGDGKRILGQLSVNIPLNFKAFIYYSSNQNLAYVGSGIGLPGMAFSIKGNSIVRSNAFVPANIMDAIDYGRKTVFAIDCDGITLLDGAQRKTYSPQNSNMSGDAVYCLFADSNNRLWAGTYRMGVNMYTENDSWFTTLTRENQSVSYDIVTAVVSSPNQLFIGLDGGGLNIYDLKTHRLQTVRNTSNGLPGDNIVAMTRDGDHLYLAAYSTGVIKYNINTGASTLYKTPNTGTAEKDNVWALSDDGMGRLWVGGPDLNIFDKRTGQFIRKALLRDVSCAAFADGGKYMWVATNHNGLYKVDKHTLRVVRHYSTKSKDVVLPENNVKYCFEDSRGNIWISAETSGVYSFREGDKRIRHYGPSSGLTSAMVTSITEDSRGHLWMGTFNGLFCYNPQVGNFVRFDEDMSVPNDFTFSANYFDGRSIYLGSTHGLLYFSPQRINFDKPHSMVSFISLSLLGDEKKIYNLYGSNPKPIKLSYNQNFFTINFSVPEIEAPRRLHFSCRLDGMEQRWRDLGDRREVAYTNVPPGKYKFYVRCTDNSGRWTSPSVVEIVVSPPWYKTVWAMLLWVILILSVIIAGIYLYLRNQAIKQDNRIGEIERRTQDKLNEAKMNFYTNITHELRTPVFLIGAQIEELMDARKSVVPVPASYLQAMHRSAAKLNKLISNVIDFRKMDAGKFSLSLKRGDVASFCAQFTEDYEDLCEQKDISYQFVCSSPHILLDFDPDKLETIISNLVSNAFKYTKEGGAVSLTVTDESDRVVFAVKDNGIGILEKMRDTIFESFFRTERGEKQSGGDGLGLSFVKSLVELHHGKIKVDSEVNKGSTFTFFIPKHLLGDKEATPVAVVAHDNVAPTDEQPSQTAPASVETPSGSILADNPTATHSILIIDDEHDTVNLLSRYLSEDFKIYQAYNGIEGLELARKYLPDIIVCDLMMPKMDGMEFLQTLKNDKVLQHIKVIIFTAKTSEEDMLKAFDNGADAYLTKPISLKLLRKRIDRLIAQSDNASMANDITSQKKSYTKEEQIFLLRCREVIDDNLENEDFNIDFLADKLAMSHSTLYKKVKAMTGQSLIDFINEYKVYKAVQLFKQGATNAESVSKQCGFRDVKNFREMFKRKMGMTPKQFAQGL